MKWITHEHVRADRVTSAWLIRRFVDPQAAFLFAPKDQVMAVAAHEDAIPFDMPGVELGHHGKACSFEAILQRLRLDRIDLYQLHRPDPNVPFEESVGALAELQRAGKIRYVGVSNVTTEQLARARRTVPIAAVENRYNLTDHGPESEEVLEVCARDGVAFLPYVPLATGELTREAGLLDQIARRHDATGAQIALAWLLQRSPVLLPIPDTSSVRHLDENIAAAGIRLSLPLAGPPASGRLRLAMSVSTRSTTFASVKLILTRQIQVSTNSSLPWNP